MNTGNRERRRSTSAQGHACANAGRGAGRLQGRARGARQVPRAAQRCVAQHGHERAVQADDGWQAGQARVRHRLRHDQRGDRHARQHVRLRARPPRACSISAPRAAGGRGRSGAAAALRRRLAAAPATRPTLYPGTPLQGAAAAGVKAGDCRGCGRSGATAQSAPASQC